MKLEDGYAGVEGTLGTKKNSTRKLHSAPPPAPQKQRKDKGYDCTSSVDPKSQLPTINPPTDGTVRVTSSDV